VHDAQSGPEWQLVAVRERHVDRRRPADAQHRAARALQTPAPDVRARVRIRAVDMRLFERMTVDRGAGPCLGPREIAGVIDVAVREQDRLHVMRLEAEVCEPPPDQPRFADETGVEQHGAVVARRP